MRNVKVIEDSFN
jgi:hypothetical protein